MPYSADSGGIPVAFPEPSPGFQAPCTRPVPDFRVTLGSHWGGFGLALGGFARLFEVWSSMFDVRCSMFRVHHKHPEYNPPLPPPSGRSGGSLDKPWTCPGTIEPSHTAVFDQPHLSRPLRLPPRGLRSTRLDGVLSAAPRCSLHVYPMWCA